MSKSVSSFSHRTSPATPLAEERLPDNDTKLKAANEKIRQWRFSPNHHYLYTPETSFSYRNFLRKPKNKDFSRIWKDISHLRTAASAERLAVLGRSHAELLTENAVECTGIVETGIIRYGLDGILRFNKPFEAVVKPH